jgi:hypothetical protein
VIIGAAPVRRGPLTKETELMSNDKTQATFHGPGWDYPPSAELDEHDGLLTQPITPRRSWARLAGVIAAVCAVIALALALRVANVLPAGIPLIGKDSGIAACEALADGTKPTGRDESLTPETYKELRQVFRDSRYPEIAEPGLRMVDLTWQFQSKDNKSNLGMALAMIGPMTQAYSSLAGGCAEHDIVIPALGQ